MHQMKRADYLYMDEINKKIEKIKSITEYNQVEELIKQLDEIRQICIGYNIYRRVNTEDDLNV
jgi:hypothetical protein